MRITHFGLVLLFISVASGCVAPTAVSPPLASSIVEQVATGSRLTPEPPRKVAPLTRDALVLLGAKSYQEFCAACHQNNGRGVSGAGITSLHQSTMANDANERFLRFVMFNEPKKQHPAWYLAMSPVALASALTYVRLQFPNTNQELIQPSEVIAELAKLSGK